MQVGHPRLGLLSLVVDAALDEKISRRVRLPLVPAHVCWCNTRLECC
jgi:hypothetical protein